MLAVAEALDVPHRAATGISEPRQDVTWSGPDAVRRLIEETEADIVVNGIAGSPGLMPSVWSLQTGKDLALANKETIVMAGPLIRELADHTGTRILPVDSEHSALFHLLAGRSPEQVERIVITASGGAPPWSGFPRSLSVMLFSIPPGTWGPRSPLTPPPWPTRAWR
jgi:1-deoxy-D-xylulose-5-phosphate reductoisomerase